MCSVVMPFVYLEINENILFFSKIILDKDRTSGLSTEHINSLEPSHKKTSPWKKINCKETTTRD
jgi:hypothetical protein